MSWTATSKRPLRIAVSFVIGLLVLLFLQWDGGYLRKTSLSPGSATLLNFTEVVEPRHQAPAIEKPSYCNALNLSRIAFITKTGATEAMDKLPPQLSTSLQCVPDPLIFSDLDQQLGPFQIHDILSRFSREAMENNPDFDIYYRQKELASQGRESELKSLAELPIPSLDWRTKGKSAAWSLDKYKFLHMIDRAWEYQPDRDWYVFIEADTYVSIANLVSFLETQISTEKLYLGNAVRMFEHPTPLCFAHGGSGFILSGATVRAFAETRKGLASRFDSQIRSSWFGDYILADALDRSLHVKVTDVLPMLQGENLMDLPFGPDSWCKPVITMHHVTPDDFQNIYDYEKSRSFSGMLFRDLYAFTSSSAFRAKKDNWENLSSNGKFEIVNKPNYVEDDDTKALEQPDTSFEACELSCSLEPNCFQFTYHTFAEKENECHISSVFRVGHAIAPGDLETGHSIGSGWMSGKIANWSEAHQDCTVE